MMFELLIFLANFQLHRKQTFNVKTHLHTAESKIGNRHHIDFRQTELNAKIRLEEWQCGDGELIGETIAKIGKRLIAPKTEKNLETHLVMFSYSGRAYILICGSDLLFGSDSFVSFRSEMWKATRYVDIFGVIMKFSRT